MFPIQALALVRSLEDPDVSLTFSLAPYPRYHAEAGLLEELDVVKASGPSSCASPLNFKSKIQQKIQKDVAAKFSDASVALSCANNSRPSKELGEGEEGAEQQVAELRKRLKKPTCPKEVMEQASVNCAPQPSASRQPGIFRSSSVMSKRSPNCLGTNSRRQSRSHRAQEILDRDTSISKR